MALTKCNLQSLALPDEWWGFAWYFAVDSIHQQYRRTRLGPLWIVLTQFVSIFGIALVFHTIFKREFAEFLPFISAGLLTWNVIASTLVAAPTVFGSASSLIHSFRIPPAVFPIQTLTGSLLLFLHGLLVHGLVLLFTHNSLALVPLGMCTMLINAAILYPLVACLAILGARFRDLAPAVGSFMYMAFLVTPVLWDKSSIGSTYAWVFILNPFTYMIDIVRRPLIGLWPNSDGLSVCIGLAIISICLGEFFFRRYSRPLVFWV